MEVEAKSLAIFGGAFNPVHLGHVSIAESAKRELGYDTILFVPSSIPAHKEVDKSTAAADRIAMMELALNGIDYIKIDTCEVERGGVSYMIETVEYVGKHYHFTGKPGLIIGDDLLSGFHKWRRVGELIERVDLIIARRISSKVQDFGYAHTYLNNPIVEVASSDIRNMVANGESITGFVSKEVSRYIDEHRLYRAP